MKRRYLALIIACLLSLLGCAQPPPSPPPAAPMPKPPPLEEGKQIINIEVDDQTLHYQRHSFWSEEKFSQILEARQKFETEQINSFKKSLEKYNKSAVNTKIKIDEVNKSTTLICDIKGAMYSANSYDFHWLLGDLPFDLYQFKQSEKELNYEGEVNGVPSKIRLIFPYTIAHCHEHVWPAK